MINVTEQFHQEAVGQIVEPRTACYISFDKGLSGGRGYFVLGSSVLDGLDVLQGQTDNPIQNWDEYEYKDYSDRLVAVEWERAIDYPHSVQSALCDVTFDNHDGFFDPGNTASPIYTNNKVNRPLKLYAGYRNAGMVPQFVGMTETAPDLDHDKKTATYHAIDFLYSIGQQELSDIVAMSDVRTNEVLGAILRQFGLAENQFNLPQGTNVIPFLFFDKGSLAGDAFKQLMEAEYGLLWLDENGIIQFRPRSFSRPASQYSFQPYSILKVTPLGSAEIINHVRISADVREAQASQEVYQKRSTADSVSADLWVVPAHGTTTIKASLDDPALEVYAPTLGRSSFVSWFTAAKSDQTEVTSGITATGELSSNNYAVTFTNNNSFRVEITELKLWGRPAKIVDHITYDASDPDSIERYGEQLLEISDNPFIQSTAQAQTLARYILSSRAKYNSTLELSIRGDVSLQIGDAVTIPGDYYGVYQIESIAIQMTGGLLTTRMRVSYSEPIDAFILGESKLNGEAVLI